MSKINAEKLQVLKDNSGYRPSIYEYNVAKQQNTGQPINMLKVIGRLI